MTTAQHKIGSGFGATQHRGRRPRRHRPDREARGRHRRLLGPRPGDHPRAGQGRRARRRPGPAAGRRPRRRWPASTASRWTSSTSATWTASRAFADRFLASGRDHRHRDRQRRRSWPARRPGSARAGRRSSRPTTSATSRWSTGCGRRIAPAAAPGWSRCPRPATAARASAGTTCSSQQGYDKWEAYGQAKTANVAVRRPARRAAARTRACGRSRCTPAAS